MGYERDKKELIDLLNELLAIDEDAKSIFTDREYQVVSLIKNNSMITYREIGEKMGFTLEHARELRYRAQYKIRMGIERRVKKKEREAKRNKVMAEKRIVAPEKVPIDDLELSVRSYNALVAIGIESAGDILN